MQSAVLYKSSMSALSHKPCLRISPGADQVTSMRTLQGCSCQHQTSDLLPAACMHTICQAMTTGKPTACAALQELASAKLQGRVLLPGNAVTVTHMGQELLLCVEGADASIDAVHGFLVGKETTVHVLLGSESMPQPEEPKIFEVRHSGLDIMPAGSTR